jgi:hypothetical protein
VVRASEELRASLAFVVFEDEVMKEWRYTRGPHTVEFLEVIKSTVSARILEIPQGETLWRAQAGCNEDDTYQGGYTPYDCERMKPLSNCAAEGRANPKGIPYLYLSTDMDAAMSEIRPWIGAWVTVGEFKTTRSVCLVNCALRHNEPMNFLLSTKSLSYEEAIWKCIDHAFATPITNRDNVAEYAPTQLIAELFRHLGYDGIVFKSLFGDAHTIVLFDMDAATCLPPKLFTAKEAKLVFEEYSHPE